MYHIHQILNNISICGGCFYFPVYKIIQSVAATSSLIAITGSCHIIVVGNVLQCLSQKIIVSNYYC